MPGEHDPKEAGGQQGGGPHGGAEPEDTKRPRQGSIMAAIQRLSGIKSSVFLRDVPEERTPVVNPRSNEITGRPRDTGHYQIIGEIARGGVGVIFKGRDVDLGRDVAMKVLLEVHKGNQDLIQRFVEEAQIGAQMQHPGIVPVYEIGLMGDDRPYFTMKLVKGETLAKQLSDRDDPKQDRRRFLAIFEQICLTMAYSHARGVVHRDLKPSNVMIGHFREVQLVDWGFAKVLGQGGVTDELTAQEKASQISIIETLRSGSAGTQSLVGSVMGTPAYMPPEQALGSVDKLDERSDVFCLGGILCEILTGKPPYTGENENVIVEASQAHLDPAFERLAKCGADKEIIEICKRCLAPGRRVRPSDASAVVKLVAQYLAAVDERVQNARLAAVEARGLAEAAQVRAKAERRRAEDARRAKVLTLALGGSILVAVLLGGGGYMAWQKGQSALVAESTARVNEALQEAARFHGLARGAPVGELGNWEKAILAAERAEADAEDGNIADDLAQVTTE
ncbi:MAG: serine/threonine-protein kinase, partial [Planctomycetota bacterium]|nr:serine/threonine-protein kinase [Planctomycetota bacterium]